MDEVFDAAEESWMGSGLSEWISAQLDPAIYDVAAEEVPGNGYTTSMMVETWQGHEFTIEWTVTMQEFSDGLLEIFGPLIGEQEVTPVRLEECWRCSVTIPREDPLGLCDPCRIQLRNL